MNEKEWDYVIKAVSKVLIEENGEFHPNKLHPCIGEIMLNKVVYFVPDGLFMMYHNREKI